MDCYITLRKGIQILGLTVEITDSAVARLCCYYDELVKWNRKINLVGKGSMENILENHFLDSLTLLPLLREGNSEKILDVGTGAGFPGLVLKTVCPHVEVTLVEPRQKRVSFLKHLIRTLGLETITIVAGRLEKNRRHTKLEQFPFITSRAFTSVVDFLDIVSPYTSKDGRIVCMKGPKGHIEAADYAQRFPAGPFTLKETHHITLPFSDAPRLLLIFTKTY